MLRSYRRVLLASLITTAACAHAPGMSRSAPSAPAPRSSKAATASDAPPAYETKAALKYAFDNVAKYCPADARPDDLDRCKQELRSGYQTADRTQQSQRTLPEYRSLTAYLGKVSPKVSQWERSMGDDRAASADEDRLRKEFSDDAHDVQLELLAISNVETDLANPRNLEGRYLTGNDLDALIAKGEKLGELAAACDGKYKGKQIPSFASDDSPEHPKNACRLSTKWKDDLREYALLVANRKAADLAARLKHALQELETNGGLDESDRLAFANPTQRIAEERKAFEPALQKLGVEMPSELFGEIAVLSRSYPDAAAKASAVDRWPAGSGHHDAAAEKAIVASVKAAGFTVVKIGLVSPNWDIEKNDVDLPLRKYRTGTVMVKRKGDALCRLYDVTAFAVYAGGGTYERPQAKLDAEARTVVTRCH